MVKTLQREDGTMRLAWALGLALAGAVLMGCSETAQNEAAQPDEVEASPVLSTGEDDDSGHRSTQAITSCVEDYSPSSVAQRGFAFDGTVTAIGPSVSDLGDSADLNLPGVTFEVYEWFTGENEDESTITVDMQVPPGQYQVGTRMLVSGEPRWGGQALSMPIAWACSFTRVYDEDTASAWRSATAS